MRNICSIIRLSQIKNGHSKPLIMKIRMDSFLPQRSYRNIAYFVGLDHPLKKTTKNASFSSSSIQKSESNTNMNSTTENSSSDFHMEHAVRETDFFGEPVTFRSLTEKESENTYNIVQRVQLMKAFDDMMLAVVSRGKICTGGGDEHGFSSQAAHAFAITWSSLLRQLSSKHKNPHGNSHEYDRYENDIGIVKQAPMLVVAAVSPILAHAGVPYVKWIDVLLSKVTDEKIQLLSLAYEATASLFDTKDDIHNDPYDTSRTLESSHLSLREYLHLRCLHYLLKQNIPAAQQALQRLLHQCPGDALALSLALELSNFLGDSQSALRISGSVASYWNERGERHRRSIGATNMNTSYATTTTTTATSANTTTMDHQSQFALGTALMSLGFAAGRRYKEAELMAEKARNTEKMTSAIIRAKASGNAIYALAQVYDGEGRAPEGISLLTGFDGIQLYEACGMYFFDAKLASYGARFALDRDGSSSDNLALRIYDSHFHNVYQYWNPLTLLLSERWWNHDDEEEDYSMESFRRVPAITQRGAEMLQSLKGSTQSMFSSWFGMGSSSSSSSSSTSTSTAHMNDSTMENPHEHHNEHASLSKVNKRTLEDILTWIPPTPHHLVDATMLLLRLTLSDAIQSNNERWQTLSEAWNYHMQMKQIVHTRDDDYDNNGDYDTIPMVEVMSHLFIHQEEKNETSDTTNTTITEVSKGLMLLSQLLELPSNIPKSNNLNHDTSKSDVANQWKRAVHHLSSAIECSTNLSSQIIHNNNHNNNNNNNNNLDTPPSNEIQYKSLGWNIDTRPLWEHVICYAALRSNDYESVCYARSICSESIALRPNCPETRWRYSLVLDQLGDHVAAQDARNTSISLGLGEGGTGAH